ncbi:Potassium efflux system KefA precursor [Suttonella ornithocola]|uniref:Potassium efflux system KefA n=2 Tax=Suttonella ornithocola TaxID=279832 RepID=A0A380N0S1_9GAMM|nr:Potassium efflux system KefA precursor [Suttonella ornithocola]
MLHRILLLLFCLISQNLFAQPALPPLSSEIIEININKLREDNSRRSQSIHTLQEQLSHSLPAERKIKQDDLSEVRVALDQIQQSIDTLSGQITDSQNRLSNTQNQCDALNARLQKLANPMANNPPSELNDSVHEQFSQCQKQVIALGTQLTLQKSALQLMQKQQKLREIQYQRYNDRFLETSVETDNTDEDLQARLKQLQNDRERLSNELKKPNKDRSERFNQNIALAIVGKQIFITTLHQDFQTIERRLQELQFADITSVSYERILAVQDEISGFEARLLTMKEQLNSNMEFISQQYGLYARQQGDKIPVNIQNRYNILQTSAGNFTQSLNNAMEALTLMHKSVDAQFTALSKSYIQKRYNFGGSWQRLPSIFERQLSALSTFIGQYSVSFKALQQAILSLNSTRILWLIGISITVALITFWLVGYASKLVTKTLNRKRLSFSTRLIIFLFAMTKYNLPYIGLLILLGIIIYLTKLPSPGANLILLIPIFILLISIPHFTIHLLKHSQLLDSADNRKLARPVTISAAIGGILLACVFMAEWILTDPIVIDAFRWLYGVYILIISYPLWQMLRKMRLFLDEHYTDHYTYSILRSIIGLIPIGFLLFGAASVLGYLNFAWLSARYLLTTLLYTLIWIGFLGLIKDLSLTAKRLALTRTNNSVFWAQDVINPIHAILRYGSLIGLIYALLYTFEWNANTPIIAELLNLLHKPLFGSSANDKQFTLMNLLLMGLLIYIVFRTGIWIKSLCYRWIYAKVADTGVRNSLAVFSQYAVVTFGFLFALRIIGIDLTAFTVFAGALGVGIGFGLQTIANNFISGILLLIERPLRNGDIITAGGYDGTVERIGMRTLTMTTFNNESIILPNSDFVTSAFRNWSHSDPIIRVILYFDVMAQYDPQQVERELLAGLRQLVEKDIICDQPPDFIPGVFAWNYSERGMTYRVQYYVNLDTHDYLGARHKVIRTLWQTCRDHGIEIAYPRTNLHFPDSSEEFGQIVRTSTHQNLKNIPNF